MRRLALLVFCSCSVLGHAETAAISRVSSDLTKAATPVASAAASAAIQGAGAAALPFEADILTKLRAEEVAAAADAEARIARQRRAAVADTERLLDEAALRLSGLVLASSRELSDVATEQREALVDAGDVFLTRHEDRIERKIVAIVDHSARTAQVRAEHVESQGERIALWICAGLGAVTCLAIIVSRVLR